ncbi:hypothetical protein XENTR_v10009022 [Xenopus tropicalis]|nr:hypothetical protein XENTR_v10009022 [Xenopus tropicalis]
MLPCPMAEVDASICPLRLHALLCLHLEQLIYIQKSIFLLLILMGTSDWLQNHEADCTYVAGGCHHGAFCMACLEAFLCSSGLCGMSKGKTPKTIGVTNLDLRDTVADIISHSL